MDEEIGRITMSFVIELQLSDEEITFCDIISIGKEFLKQMGMKSFKEKNPEFSDEVIGNTMIGYFGGRTECKIRKTTTKVDLLDFLSMYPTVCTLQDLWKFVIAESIGYNDATDEIRNFVDKFNLEDLQNKDNWKQFQAIVQVMPEDDVLSLRAQYGDKHAWNIGISPVTSKIPLWYSLADIIALKLYTGKTPKILKALRFVAGPPQNGLKEIDIHGIKIDPYTQDLFKELIQYRKQIQENRDRYDKDDSEYRYPDRKQQVVKIITNAISYGIFVEITTLDRNQIPVDVHGLVNFQQKKDKIERPGFMFNPIIAVSIASASRLLLTATEILLARHGVTHAYCDTDSMALPPQHTKEVQDFFANLNPYNFDADIFKLEKLNVWLYGISAKRYCLYTIDEKTGDVIIDKEKYSVHGLGMAPAANIGDNFALFEPVHGAAFDIAGQNIANPSSFLLSIKMMLDWLGNKHNDSKCIEVGAKLESTIFNLVKSGVKTKDIGGNESTVEFTKHIADNLQK